MPIAKAAAENARLVVMIDLNFSIYLTYPTHPTYPTYPPHRWPILPRPACKSTSEPLSYTWAGFTGALRPREGV